MKLIPEKFYRIQFTNWLGGKEDYVAEYCGVEDGEFAHCEECEICGKDGHTRIHQFNYVWGAKSIDEIKAEMDQGRYQTFYIGTSCIKKCKIEEIKK